MTGAGHRLVEVPPQRLARWAEGFAQRHGGSEGAVVDGALVLSGADGSRAEIEVPWSPGGDPELVLGPAAGTALVADDLAGAVQRLVAHAATPRTALLVLVRRGGFGAGLARDGELLTHSQGTRYVQGRTAAGGWSQQRFARRRSGQAAVLAGSAADAVAKVLAAGAGTPEVLVPGGDRGLLAEVLSDPRLTGVASLPRGPLLDVRDPRLVVLQETARRAQALRIRVTDPA